MRKLIAVALLLGALGFAGQGTWLQGKAIVAQWLIAQAWEQQLSSGKQVRPWSWADTWPVAKLTAPDGSISYVLSGVSGQALAFGPGKLDNGVGPGDIGTLLLAGHQDSHFAFMQRLKTGDRLRIQAANGEEYQYRIDSQRVVARNVLSYSTGALNCAWSPVIRLPRLLAAGRCVMWSAPHLNHTYDCAAGA